MTATAGRETGATANAWWAPGLIPHERDPATVEPPGWAVFAEEAIRAARPADGPVMDTWQDAFAVVLRPFADVAAARVCAAHLSAPAADVARATTARLVPLAARTLVAELHRHSADGLLRGADGGQRFHDFVRRLSAPDPLADLLAAYPVLARLLADAASRLAAGTVELLDRLRADRAAVADALLDGRDPGRLDRLDLDRGDPHDGGRTVAVLSFASGDRLVYKPRDVSGHTTLSRFLALLAEHVPYSPTPVRALPRPGYGWLAHIAPRPLADRDAACRFYRRQGALLAVLHLLRATDVHCENVVAEGDQPVVVDVETLFHPPTRPSDDPAAEALATSVRRTGLLPVPVVGAHGVADLSGLGGGAGGASPASTVSWADGGTDRMRLVRGPATLATSNNRPTLGGDVVDPADHTASLLAGFRTAYRAIDANRAAFADLIAECAELPVRVLLRPTWLYRTLLDESTHPDLLRDAADRDAALASLHDLGTGADARAAETAQLWAGDIPLFLARAGGNQARPVSGGPAEVALPVSGTAAAAAVLAGMDATDRRCQEWIIRAALAARPASSTHRQAPAASSRPGADGVHRDTLLGAARSVADGLIADGFTAKAGGLNWLSLDVVDGHWMLLPSGAGLDSGRLGVALFLAQLAATTGAARYAEHASQAVVAVPPLIARLAERPEAAEAAGCGGLRGLGGIAYGLARIAVLLDRHDLADAASTALALAGTATGSDLGWADGLAGCLAAAVAVHAELGHAPAAALARRCADALAKRADALPTVPGFADGAAGIAWALARHGTDPHHAVTAARAAATAAPLAVTGAGWCSGRAGLALVHPDPEEGRATLTTAPVPHDLSLCHGELGIADVIITLTSTTGEREPACPVLLPRTARTVDLLRRHGPVSGTPGGVRTPGLLNGCAGIGYGLLRTVAPDDVPSALLLEPASRPR